MQLPFPFYLAHLFFLKRTQRHFGATATEQHPSNTHEHFDLFAIVGLLVVVGGNKLDFALFNIDAGIFLHIIHIKVDLYVRKYVETSKERQSSLANGYWILLVFIIMHNC